MKRLFPLAMPVIAACAGPPGAPSSDARKPFDPVEPEGAEPNDDGDSVPRLGVGPASSGPTVRGPEISPWIEEPAPVIDCAAIPEEPTDITPLPEPHALHDVIFDTNGNLIGSDGTHLTASQYPTDNSIWVPNTGYVDGMDWLPDGDMVAARYYDIVRINPASGESVITSAVGGYGVVVGPDGMVYVAGNPWVMKLDPETGLHEEWVENPSAGASRVLEFSPDYSRMYFAGGSPHGDVFVVDLDEELKPVGDARVFVGDLAELPDAMGVDLCGNVYVSDYVTETLFRITPGGDVSVLASRRSDLYQHVHGLDWGSGLNEWRTDAIYAAWPYSGHPVTEIVVGIPSREYQGRYELVNAEW
jgi:streptogramin lyase